MPDAMTPVTRDPARVVLLTSRRAPGLAHLLSSAAGAGRVYDVVGCIASADLDPADAAHLELAGVPLTIHAISTFADARRKHWRDLGLRALYDRATVSLLRGMGADIVALSGYLLILTNTMLRAFPQRVINVHDSDLTRLGADGRPLYRGLRATRDAILAGEAETRTTAHLVTADVDVGPPLVRSWGFPVPPVVRDARAWGATDILKACAYVQREWMMRAAWGPVLSRAITIVARDPIRIADGQAWVGDEPAPEDLRPTGREDADDAGDAGNAHVPARAGSAP